MKDKVGIYSTPAPMARAAWSEEAACAWSRPDPRPDFFAGPGTAGERRALRMCSTCPVRERCLQEALTIETVRLGVSDERANSIDLDGIWGGTTHRQRSMTRHIPGCKDRKGHRACRSNVDRLDLLNAGFNKRASTTGLKG